MLHPFYRIDGTFDILNEPVHDTHPALLLNIPHPDEPEKNLDLSRVWAMAERRVMRHRKVVGLFSKVYGVAKVAAAIMKAHGLKTDGAPGGIGFHIRRAEEAMGSEVTDLMLKTTEELYYALYASLNIEITNVDICDGYLFDDRERAGTEKRDELPEQSHLGLMFRACKEVLRSEEICELLNREIIRQHQADYVRWAVQNSAREGYYPKDQLGYRQYILRLVAHPESPALLTWYGLIPEHMLTPPTALTVLTERYINILKKEREGMEGMENKRNSTTSMEVHKTSETVRTLANREAASAMLNGITVGEFRRIEGTLPLKDYAANMKCICFNFCNCAKECTKKASRTCPCSARMSRVYTKQEVEPQTAFEERYGDLTEAVFEGLCVTGKGETVKHMAAELKMGLDLFHQEVIDFRRGHIKMSLK